jgi:hypothetical protein
MDDRTDEILSAISMLSQRIENVEGKLDKLSVKADRIELLTTEMAKKLLAPAEQRALGIPVTALGGGTPATDPLPRAAKGR